MLRFTIFLLTGGLPTDVQEAMCWPHTMMKHLALDNVKFDIMWIPFESNPFVIIISHISQSRKP
jgi:hypothetical protein